MSESHPFGNLFNQDLPAARRTDPETSHEAARSIDLDSLRRSQRVVLAALHSIEKGTDTDILERLRSMGSKISTSGARTRRSELLRMGLVRDTGERVRLESGRRGIVWEVVL